MAGDPQIATSHPRPGPFARPANVLVTGASRGIGRAIARRLCDSGTARQVFALSRAGGGAQRGVDDPRLVPVPLDVTDEGSIEAAMAHISARVDRVDLVVNCVGLLHDGDLRPERRLADVDPDAVTRSFEVNALGLLLLAKHVQPLLPARDPAVFASLSARVGSIADNRLGGWYGYRAAKAAHNMIVKTLSIELRRRARGIVCVSLHPGTVETDLSRPFLGNVPPQSLASTDTAARRLLAVIESLDPNDNGGFLAWDGQPIPW